MSDVFNALLKPTLVRERASTFRLCRREMSFLVADQCTKARSRLGIVTPGGAHLSAFIACATQLRYQNVVRFMEQA